MDDYRSKNWAKFREDVFRLDGYACTICGKTAADGAALQAHHKQYLTGRKPWEYPHNLCATVCKGCHAAEHGIIAPRVGWVHEGWDDLGDLSGTCEYCGNEIRYVFLVHHPKWRTLEVGEICCDNLTSTTLASNHMESQRRYLNRRRTFVASKRWQQHSQTHHTIVQKRVCIEVRWTSEGGFQLEINGRRGKLVFKSAIEAKIHAFDMVESGALEAYLTRQRKMRRSPGRPRR